MLSATSHRPDEVVGRMRPTQTQEYWEYTVEEGRSQRGHGRRPNPGHDRVDCDLFSRVRPSTPASESAASCRLPRPACGLVAESISATFPCGKHYGQPLRAEALTRNRR